VNRESAREWTRRLYQRYMPGEPDAYTTFIHLADSSCPEGGRVVDLGCGKEEYLSCLVEKAGEVVGVDERCLQGSYHHHLQADLNRKIPLREESVDLAASKFLLEHLEDPQRFLREVHRILRASGRLVLMTPNVLYYPYGLNLLLSRFLAQETRMRLVQAFSGRPADDIFPVHYRCNTPKRMREQLERAGFEITHMDTYSDYLVSAVARPLGAAAVAYEKMTRKLGLHDIRGFIVVSARKV
jgi:ubiquinone/menaquinone biosynthesis C-methylase UbiE